MKDRQIKTYSRKYKAPKEADNLIFWIIDSSGLVEKRRKVFCSDVNLPIRDLIHEVARGKKLDREQHNTMYTY
jgi:hypothetical protein